MFCVCIGVIVYLFCIVFLQLASLEYPVIPPEPLPSARISLYHDFEIAGRDAFQNGDTPRTVAQSLGHVHSPLSQDKNVELHHAATLQAQISESESGSQGPTQTAPEFPGRYTIPHTTIKLLTEGFLAHSIPAPARVNTNGSMKDDDKGDLEAEEVNERNLSDCNRTRLASLANMLYFMVNPVRLLVAMSVLPLMAVFAFVVAFTFVVAFVFAAAFAFLVANVLVFVYGFMLAMMFLEDAVRFMFALLVLWAFLTVLALAMNRNRTS
ncbi:hypothetical protein BJ138DRAFT_1180064 [Hygrophoropsis aurantiaca]|uniref:Uncharacterized protein n=1 Tax=Hygrophoropsis aurantiaca TaxID=72124 RepID=A0ACB8ACA1_9AGAM|nr:hypothetical protein BJ138DRAFT_1180064 [Hygrophoropsis aurantiaca]